MEVGAQSDARHSATEQTACWVVRDLPVHICVSSETFDCAYRVRAEDSSGRPRSVATAGPRLVHGALALSVSTFQDCTLPG